MSLSSAYYKANLAAKFTTVRAAVFATIFTTFKSTE
jgi:hypothetical protein